MRRLRYLHHAIVFLSCATMLISGGCGPGRDESPASSSQTDASDKPTIAVIPKGTTHSFWKTIHAGAVKAAQESGTEIIWVGPEREDDRRQQIDVVQNFISRKVDAIVLAPLDKVALVRPVETAVTRGIPVVIMDSGLDSDKQSSFVATDNREGGRMAARHMGQLMDGKGQALMLRYAEGSASTMEREEGWLEVMKEEFPGVELVSTNQYGGATTESALQASQNLLNKFPDVGGIFCCNESTTFGMLRALQQSGRAGEVIFVGFDTKDAFTEAIRKGELHGTVSQDPFDMGYRGVMTAVAVLNGKQVEPRVATNITLITPENLDTEEVADLLNPPLEKWLK